MHLESPQKSLNLKINIQGLEFYIRKYIKITVGPEGKRTSCQELDEKIAHVVEELKRTYM